MYPRISLFPARRAVVVAALALPLVVAGCSAPAPALDSAPATNGFGHVHGISVDPVTTKILLATHDGLYDATEKTAVKVSDTIDLMGFTATNDPEIFYASGHPGAGSSLPNPVGLIHSTDAGRTWEELSLGGQSDFHALTASGGGLVAFDGQLRTSHDGVTWDISTAAFTPAVLAGNPASTVVLATTEEGVQRSTDAGKTWQPVPNSLIIQFAAFATSTEKAPTEAVGVAPNGSVHISTDAGLSWTATGKITGQIEAITALEGSNGKPRIWAATTTGIQVSDDGGETFRPAAS